MQQAKITIGNVCFLVDKDQKVLLLERSFEPMKGMFTGVGGKTKFDEDVHDSCIREIKEETGLYAKNLNLKAVIKTVLEGSNSSWILFVYTGHDFSGKLIKCPEGELKWVSVKDLEKVNLIGFIRELIPAIFTNSSVLEGTLFHDKTGNVTRREIKHLE